MQAIYMTIIALGKFVALYGNASTADGSKGGGALGNLCFMDYNNAKAGNMITGVGTGGTCNVTNSGSAFIDLVGDNTTARRRLCQGIVLYNNLLDILSNITLPASAELGDLDDIDNVMTTIYDAAELVESGTPPATSAVSTIRNILNQAECEDSANVSDAELEIFYATMMEAAYQ
jgi:hypothetical protein